MTEEAATGRTAAFARNLALEALLKDINTSLWPAEQATLASQGPQPFPAVFIMGPMRSGTTLFMQWLANTGLFAYPTNLLSRFYQAPVIGAKIQLLLTDPRYNFRDELNEFRQTAAYESENGKTRGVLAPNEFWYFWRRMLAEPGRDVWTDDELRASFDTALLRAELAGLTSVFQKPFAAKGLLFNYNIPFLNSVLEKAVFIHIERDPVANVASVLDARRRQLGDVHAWYSFKIPEYEQLKDLDPVRQVAGQVSAMNRAVARGLRQVPAGRQLTVRYEQFCADPAGVFRELVQRVFPGEVRDYTGPSSFPRTRAEAAVPQHADILRALSEQPAD